MQFLLFFLIFFLFYAEKLIMSEKKRFLGLKKFRERMKLRQNELSKMLGCKNNTTYSNWETGKRDPSFEIVLKLLELGATVEELFGVEYASTHGYVKPEPVASSDQDVLKRLKALENEMAGMKKTMPMPPEPHIEALEARMDKLEGIKKSQKDSSHAEAG
jgi:transcriptional regulator with XRE-family HTH domain